MLRAGRCFYDALKFIEDTADKAGVALEDVGEAAAQAYQSVSDTAGRLWNDTTDAVSGAWNWMVDYVGENGETVRESVSKAMGALNDCLSTCAEMTDEVIKDAFEKAMESFDIAQEDVAKLWKTISEYADSHHINLRTGAKLATAVVAGRLAGGRIGAAVGGHIVDVLIDWLETNDITSDEAADRAAADLEGELLSGKAD